MLELGPGIYSGVRLTSGARERIWRVLQEWFAMEQDASIVMLWHDSAISAGQAVRVLGVPPVRLVSMDGLVLSKRNGEPLEQSLD
ncbi:MAG: type I-E CRISPR-associated endoribonuclease Cas2e, partial [Chloroflexota bacterium]